MKIILLLVCMCYPWLVGAQNPVKLIDSLKIELAKKPDKTRRAKVLADLTWYYSMVNADSAEVYGVQSLELAKKLGDSAALAQALSDFAVVKYTKGEFDATLKKYKEALHIRKALKDDKGIASLHYKMGTAFHRKTQLDSAMVYYLKALEYYEGSGNDVLANSAQSNIGALHFNQKNYKEAMNYFEKNIVFFRKNGELKLLSNALVNKASIQLIQRDTVLAQATLLESITIAKSINNIETLGSAYNNLSEIYLTQDKVKEAKEALALSLQFRKEANLIADIASSQLTLAGLHNATGEFVAARKLLMEIKPYYLKEDIKEKLATLYLQNIIALSSLKSFDSVRYYTNAYTKIQDEVYGEQVLKFTNELEEKYETQKKENQILQQRAQLAEKDLEVRRKNTLIYGGFGLALLLGVVGYLFNKQQKLKNRQLKKEAELQTALSKIETQNKLQEQRLRISRDLHDNIGSQLTFVTSSIDNLKYALEGSNEKVTQKLGNISEFTTQTIYELRDTIWAMNKSKIKAEDLQVRIANLIEKAGKATQGVSFAFNVGEGVSEKVFSSVQGMNMYRIIQEAVNNSLKYAKAKNISVHIEKTSETPPEESSNFKAQHLKIKIQDDGVGFKPASIKAGNGLANIKKRTRDMEGIVTIVSEEGKGTTVAVIF